MEADKQFKNPTPVAVAIIPVETKVSYNIKGQEIELELNVAVYGRRNIEPKLGMLALPGGFVNEMERLETGGKREVKEETGLEITEDEFKLFRSEITPNNRNLIFGITPTRTPDIAVILEENWKNDEEIRKETQGFVIAGLNIKDAAFPLHQKALGIYLNDVNGSTIQMAEKELTEKIGKDGVLELIEKMKQDGYLSSDYQYELKNKPKFKV